jgi:hypothetical protein
MGVQDSESALAQVRWINAVVVASIKSHNQGAFAKRGCEVVKKTGVGIANFLAWD